MSIARYVKAIAMIAAAGLSVFASAFSDGVTPVEAVNVGIAVVTAVGVYWIPNLATKAASYLKTYVAVAGTVLSAVAVLVANATSFGAVSVSDWMGVAVVGLGAIAVHVLPNKDYALAA